MKLSVMSGVLAVLLTPQLMANTTADSLKSTGKLKSSRSEFNKTSSSIRESKKFSFNTSIVGITHNALSQSIEGSYHLNANTFLGVQLNNMKSGIGTVDEEKYSEDELETWRRNGRGSSLSFNAKYFVSNSFYLKAGAFYRNQEHINETGSSLSIVSGKWIVVQEESGSIEDIGLTLKIGNQWQWNHFTLGCDWIGTNRSISTLSKTGIIEKEDLHSINLLNFYIGASF